MKQIVPNIDGQYVSKKKGIRIVVTRGTIEVEVTGPKESGVIDLDAMPSKDVPTPGKIEQIHKGVQLVNDLLVGPSKKG